MAKHVCFGELINLEHAFSRGSTTYSTKGRALNSPAGTTTAACHHAVWLQSANRLSNVSDEINVVFKADTARLFPASEKERGKERAVEKHDNC